MNVRTAGVCGWAEDGGQHRQLRKGGREQEEHPGKAVESVLRVRECCSTGHLSQLEKWP